MFCLAGSSSGCSSQRRNASPVSSSGASSACASASPRPRGVHPARRSTPVKLRSAQSSASAAGGWRIGKDLMPCFVELAEGIEAAMRRDIGTGLHELQVPEEFNWANVEGFTMENRFYQSQTFRKAHMELATGAKGLQILHFVMYPYAEYNLPMYSLDMVAFGSRVTLAISDVCPVTQDLSLPPAYDVVKGLKQQYLGHLPARPVPDWGTRCLSKECACVSPDDPESVEAFVKFAVALFEAHMKIAKAATPSTTEEQVQATLKAQQSYCSSQLENLKTRREQYFGAEFTAGYMDGVMFDVTADTPVRAPVA